MADRQITEAELLTRVLDSRLREVHTAIPGRVQTFDRATHLAGIIPQVWPDGDELSVLPAVPVIFPVIDGKGLIFDLAGGDPGLLVFAESDLSQWRQQGEPGAPADLGTPGGRHNMQSAVFFPGLIPRGEETTFDAGTCNLIGSDVRLGEYNAAEAAVLGDLLKIAFTNWTTAHNTWLSAVAGAVPALAGAATTMTGANATLLTDIQKALSVIVKIK